MDTLQVCMAQRPRKFYIPGLLPKDRTYLGAFSPFFYLFLFLSQTTDIFLLIIANVHLYVCIFISCIPTMILLYWLILWFTNRSELTSVKDQSINQLLPWMACLPPSNPENGVEHNRGTDMFGIILIPWSGMVIVGSVLLSPAALEDFSMKTLSAASGCRALTSSDFPS